MFTKIIKKLNNFKFTAMLIEIVSGVAALYSLGAILLYHFSGDLDKQSKGLIRNVGFSNVENGAYLGMVLFFAALLSLLISIFVCYSVIPFIKNKEKTSPRKGLLLAGFVSSIFELLLIVFMILLLVMGNPNTKIGIILTLPLGILSMIGCALYIIPFIKCDFYMPEIKRQ